MELMVSGKSPLCNEFNSLHAWNKITSASQDTLLRKIKTFTSDIDDTNGRRHVLCPGESRTSTPSAGRRVGHRTKSQL